jgi:AAA family ATP:ADP antiporter
MIGGYWLLRSLKDPVLTALCGVESIPKAKILSVFVVLAVVAVYNHLLDEKSGFRKEQLFYVFGTFYGILFLVIAYLLNHPTYGLPNPAEDPTRLLGWVSYCGIESFGSVMVSLFWSFANSNFNLKQAKRSYGVMVATAQLGSILGPTFVNSYGHSLGIPICYMVGAGCMLTLQLTMWTYVKMFGVAEEAPKGVERKEDPKKGNKAGILEGIHLFMEHNYVKGIFAMSCLFMVEVTIVDYTMKVLAREHFSEEFPCLPIDEATGEVMACWDTETNSAVGLSSEAIKAFTTFMGLFGQATNGLSFFLSFFGTSAILRYFGLRTTLLLFPSICLIVIIIVRMYPTLNTVFAAMMILKANSYALNNPTKEMLYQPTSSNVKYKAKSWIDIFGARGSKALGSVVTNAFASSATELVDKGSIVGMCVASFLIWNARFMGKKFDEYTESGYIVGEANDDDDDAGGYAEVNGEGKSNNVELTSRQNDESETSCAFYDDDEIGEEEEGQSISGEDHDEKHLVATV